MPLDEEAKALVTAYQAELNRLGPMGRLDFVSAARRGEDWPQPTEPYLASHARKWLPGLKGPQYAQRAYDLKNSPGVHIYAYIHPVHRNRGLAFVDLTQDAIVLFDCDKSLNYDLFSPPNGAKRWLRDHAVTGTHWRLKDTER